MSIVTPKQNHPCHNEEGREDVQFHCLSTSPQNRTIMLWEAGSLTNRTVTIRTKRRFRHPRTGGTAVLHLSTTTEL